jgi:nucleotide-binding universal stress UspA family protein
MTRHVMVPLDGSGFAEAALAKGAEMTGAAGDVLELVLVQEVGPPFALEAWHDVYPEAARKYLDGVAERVQAEGRTVQTTVLLGRPATELETRAKQAGADLVVMATHGRGPMSRFWLGSVTDEFVRHTHTPVLLVRPEEGGEQPASAPPYKVMIPLDGSELAESVLGTIRALPGMEQAEFTLVRIVRYPDELVSAYMPGTVQMSHQVVEEGLNEAHTYIDALAARLATEGLDVKTHVSVESRPAASILCFAEDHDMDMIAMATHGRGGLTRTVMGSVTDKIVRGAHVPVLVVRPDLPG